MDRGNSDLPAFIERRREAEGKLAAIPGLVGGWPDEVVSFLSFGEFQ